MFEYGTMLTFQEQIEAYKAKKKAIDAAPIKKVAEAKARKKRKVSIIIFKTILCIKGNEYRAVMGSVPFGLYAQHQQTRFMA